MYVIAMCNSKGGVGKTTLTAALAVRAAKDSKRVALVDLDPQRSLAAWWDRRGKSDNPCIFTGEPSAPVAVEALLRDGWDWVFLDGPPAFLTVIEESIQAADLTVVPVKGSMLDLHASQDAVVLARDAGARCLAVLNDVGQHEVGLAESAQATLRSGDVDVADTMVRHRRAHITGMTVGKSAAEVDGGKHKDAATEIDALWAEVKAAAIAGHKAKAKASKKSGAA